MTCWRWYLSICACRLSRRASRSWFWGPRSVTTLSTPAQKLSGSRSVPGSASLLMKSYSTWATRRLPTVTRSVIFPPSPARRSTRHAVDPAYPRVTQLYAVRRLTGHGSQQFRSARSRAAGEWDGARRGGSQSTGQPRQRRGESLGGVAEVVVAALRNHGAFDAVAARQRAEVVRDAQVILRPKACTSVRNRRRRGTRRPVHRVPRSGNRKPSGDAGERPVNRHHRGGIEGAVCGGVATEEPVDRLVLRS